MAFYITRCWLADADLKWWWAPSTPPPPPALHSVVIVAWLGQQFPKLCCSFHFIIVEWGSTPPGNIPCMQMGGKDCWPPHTLWLWVTTIGQSCCCCWVPELAPQSWNVSHIDLSEWQKLFRFDLISLISFVHSSSSSSVACGLLCIYFRGCWTGFKNNNKIVRFTYPLWVLLKPVWQVIFLYKVWSQ